MFEVLAVMPTSALTNVSQFYNTPPSINLVLSVSDGVISQNQVIDTLLDQMFSSSGSSMNKISQWNHGNIDTGEGVVIMQSHDGQLHEMNPVEEMQLPVFAPPKKVEILKDLYIKPIDKRLSPLKPDENDFMYVQEMD